ncbi:hypothetical protein J4474_00860 [Candidatus Pacearchaeota archaeon]|nr:hypothetical protein [Candidatus Pacearchaeota archaeon]
MITHPSSFCNVDNPCSFDYTQIEYFSSNEILQGVYRKINSVKGRGLFVIGGFDQVASLIASSDLEKCLLFDVREEVIRYAKFRMHLTGVFQNSKDYFDCINSSQSSFLFRSFIRENPDNWLSSEEKYQKVQKIFSEGKVNFINLNLFQEIDSLEEEYSLVYLSNIHEWVSKTSGSRLFDLYLDNLKKIKINDLTKWVFTNTQTRQGEIHVGKINNRLITQLFNNLLYVENLCASRDNGAP